MCIRFELAYQELDRRLIFCIQKVLSNTHDVHVQRGRTNADLCIDGKSGFSHCISCLHVQLCTPYLQMAAVQENFLLSGYSNTLKRTRSTAEAM